MVFIASIMGNGIPAPTGLLRFIRTRSSMAAMAGGSLDQTGKISYIGTICMSMQRNPLCVMASFWNRYPGSLIFLTRQTVFMVRRLSSCRSRVCGTCSLISMECFVWIKSIPLRLFRRSKQSRPLNGCNHL